MVQGHQCFMQKKVDGRKTCGFYIASNFSIRACLQSCESTVTILSIILQITTVLYKDL